MHHNRGQRFACWLLALGALSGCKGKDPQKCDEALSTTRSALARETFDAAQQWREYAWKHCEDRAVLDGLDRELTAKRAEVENRKRAAEQAVLQKRELLRVFLTWTAENRAAPEKASVAPSCDPFPDNDKKAEAEKRRLCTATRTAGSAPLMVRYFEAEPTAARFSIKLPESTSCEEIGAGKPLKTWAVAATGGRTVPRHRCEFGAGPLAGLQAVVSEASNADLYVFAPSYLDKEPSYRSILDAP